MSKVTKTCTIEACERPVENVDMGLCATHARAMRKSEKGKFHSAPKRINKVSLKTAKALAQYIPKKNVFLKDKMCAVYPHKKATTVHHARGRVGYYDKWARDNNIPLLIDERFWVPASIEGHRHLEENPDWAKKHGFSGSRAKKVE